MSEIKRRVYSPRGDRGGGGLVAQVTIDEADVQRWLTPSALARITVQREVSSALTMLLRDVVAALAAREEAEGRAADEATRRQPGELPHEGSGASALTTGDTSQPTGPIPTEQKPT